jgi:hypothetical protein
MRLLLGVLACCVACRPTTTEVVVSVDVSGIQVPTDIDSVHLDVVDLDAATSIYSTPDAPLCGGGATPCTSLPLTVSLHPGPKQPSDRVEVTVTASQNGVVRIRDAATFTFSSGQRGRLPFVLYAACLGSLDCPNQTVPGTCGESGVCTMSTVVSDPPDASSPTSDAGVSTDASMPSSIDLAGTSALLHCQLVNGVQTGMCIENDSTCALRSDLCGNCTVGFAGTPYAQADCPSVEVSTSLCQLMLCP